jgi:tripartite-type tricarboxylate transporter receptor subunit TctC
MIASRVRPFVLCCAMAAAAFASPSFSQVTGKVVRVMNGFPPGGSADIVTRLVADRLRGTYASTLIVENKPGGGGRTVLEQAKGAEPDGTTIVLTPTAVKSRRGS